MLPYEPFRQLINTSSRIHFKNGFAALSSTQVKKFSRFRKLRADAQSLWDESALRSQTELSKLEKVAHFCLMVWRSFTRNRCPVRASALAYATLLALIPMLAVVMSITSTFLKKEGEERIDQFIVKMVASVTPEAVLATNEVKEAQSPKSEVQSQETESNQKSEIRGQKSEVGGQAIPEQTSNPAATLP